MCNGIKNGRRKSIKVAEAKAESKSIILFYIFSASLYIYIGIVCAAVVISIFHSTRIIPGTQEIIKGPHLYVARIQDMLNR